MIQHVAPGKILLLNMGAHRRYYNVLQGGMDVALAFPKACDEFLGTPGALSDLFSPDNRTESKLEYLKKLLDHNNIICLQDVHGKGRVSSGSSTVGYAISVLCYFHF